MTQAEISRTQIIVADHVGENEFGDLIFTDKEGNDYKVSNKRKQYFKCIVNGAAIELSYSTYKGNEYIYSAKLVKDMLPTPESPEGKKTDIKGDKISKPKYDIDNIRNRSMAIAYAKDLACYGKIEIKDITTYANKFLTYILEEIPY